MSQSVGKALISPAIGISLLVGLVIWTLSFLNAYRIIEGYLYDYLLISTPLFKTTSSNEVLLIETRTLLNKVEKKPWLDLLQAIEHHQPKQVIFSFLPHHASEIFYQEAKRYGNVLFGRQILGDLKEVAEKDLEAWPDKVGDLNLPYGIAALPPSQYGVYRLQYKKFQIGQQTYPSLEALAVDESMRPSKHYFYIDFSSANLPFLTYEQVLKGDLIPELVKGRHVLIGAQVYGTNQLTTPLILNGETLTPLQFHGQALQTLLSRNAIFWTGGIIRFLIILGVSFLSMLFWNVTKRKGTYLFLTVILILDVFLAWLLLVVWSIWIPLLALWLVHITLFVVLTRYHYQQEEKGIWSTLLTLSAKVQDRHIPEKIYATEEYWSKIIIMVSQTFQLERAIFLEAIPNSHRIEEVNALNCSLDDIHEKRRDYHRTPYRDALESHKIIRVNEFFTCGVKQEKQYLVPLIYLNQPMGFWVFSIKSQEKMNENTKAYVHRLSNHIARFLFFRRQWQEEQAQKNKWFNRYLNLEAHYNVVDKLQTILSQLDRQLIIMDDYLNVQSSAAIYFDVFGRVLIANKQVLKLLQRAKISPYEITALDLLETLTDLNREEARETLQTIIVEGKEAIFKVQLPHHYDKNFLLRLAATNLDKELEELRSDNLMGLERQGFLCEFIDETASNQFKQMRK